jgi:16S rRNA (uracil1498-N3)-methyltransferase
MRTHYGEATPAPAPRVHRFFAPSLDPGDETVTLPREESEHLTRVLRLTVGDIVAVFDGRGHEFLARVTGAAVGPDRRREIAVQLLSRVEPAVEPSVALTLVQAVLKADKMDDIVRDAVMLGAAAIHPIISHRTEATVAAVMRGSRLQRWRRVALASVKQSRRATLPEIRMPLGFKDFLAEPPPALRLMLVEPSAGVRVESIGVLRQEPPPADAAVLVGPEGGWTEEECAAARAQGVRLICLGQRTLRADAAPIAAISVLQFLWNDL